MPFLITYHSADKQYSRCRCARLLLCERLYQQGSVYMYQSASRE